MFNKKQVREHLLTLCSIENLEDEATILGKIVREIRSEPIVRREYSSTEIQAVMQHIVREALDFKKKDERFAYVKASVEDLNREFRTELGTWNFTIPIENLKLQPRSFKIGDVTFFTFTPHKRKKMKSMMWKLLRDNPHYDIEWKKNYVKSHDEKELSRIEGKTCALVQIKGKLEKAHLTAYDKVETAIAILKLYRYALYDTHQKYFHFTGKVVPQETRITLCYTNDGRNISTLLEMVGFLFPFELDNKRIRFMKKAGFEKINKILKKENPSELEKQIINSIRLFGSACDVVVTKSRKQRPPLGVGSPLENDSKPKTTFEKIALNERLVRLFIALESLLIFHRNEPLAENMSERCAFLLGKTMKRKRETYDIRKRIRDFIKDMYELRSSYVHHGKSEIDHTTLSIFTRYVSSAIFKVLFIKDQTKLTTSQDLREWFERKKLS